MLIILDVGLIGLVGCLRVFIAVIKHRGRKELVQERAYALLELSVYGPSLREVRVGTQGRNLEAEEHGVVLLTAFSQPDF